MYPSDIRGGHVNGNHRLGPGDTDALLPLLKGVAPNWREVARGLGFTHEELETVLSDRRLQSQLDYLEETVAQWLRWSPQNKHPYPLTEELVRTLRLEEVGEYAVAEEVEKHPVFMAQDRCVWLQCTRLTLGEGG